MKLKWAISDFYTCIPYCKTLFVYMYVSCNLLHNTVIVTQYIFFSLKTGDEILELNGESMHGLTHYDALQKFKVTYCSSRTISVYTQCARELNRFIHSLFFLAGQKGSSDTYSQDKLQPTSFCFQLSVTPLVSLTELQYMHNQRKQLFQFRKGSVLIKCHKAQWQGHNGSYPKQR